MKLLALDTSTDLASVALLLGDEITFLEQSGVKTHAQSILPLIHQLLSQAELSLGQLDGLVFGCGPGSFTGLRISCSITQGLAVAHDLGVIPIGSLDAIVFGVRKNKELTQYPTLALLDARMQQLYWAYYPVDSMQQEAQVDAAAFITVKDSKFVIAGIGFDPYEADLPPSIQKQHCPPHAKYMVELAQNRQPIAAQNAQPIYVRNQVIQTSGKNHG